MEIRKDNYKYSPTNLDLVDVGFVLAFEWGKSHQLSCENSISVREKSLQQSSVF